MVLPNFITVPNELVYLANIAWRHCGGMGGKLFAEKVDHDHPETATMLIESTNAQEFIIVEPKLRSNKLELWTAYAKACALETKVTFYLPENATIAAGVLANARKNGVGIRVVSLDGNVIEVAPNRDLTFNVSLPPVSRVRVNLRKKVQIIHKTFEDDWKRGFEDACKLVEKCARNRLKREAANGTLKIVEGNKTKNLSVARVEKLTLGQLATSFCNKVSQTRVDRQLCGGLQRINPDRVNIAHDKLSRRRLNKLRERVGGHMWTIHNLLSVMA